MAIFGSHGRSVQEVTRVLGGQRERRRQAHRAGHPRGSGGVRVARSGESGNPRPCLGR
jgi:hypothetical protein